MTGESRLLGLLKAKLGGQIVHAEYSINHAVAVVKREVALDFFKILKLDAELDFKLLVDITAVDWFDSKTERFEVVYHLASLRHLHRMRVKISVAESDATVDSVVSVWPGANLMEREAWDMYGIKFKGHPDLRRVLMYDEFVGHPLRKDYPVQGKQPRIKLRYPEVRNTAVDMHRPELVRINPRQKDRVAQSTGAQ